MRRAGRSLAFAAAAAWVAWAAWPGPAGNIATAVARVDVVTVLLVLAGLPLLARRLFGPPAAGPVARVLRAGAYAAVLVSLDTYPSPRRPRLTAGRRRSAGS